MADRLADSPAHQKLGRAMDLAQTAVVIGCSPWTVRQKLVKRGLPFFRSEFDLDGPGLILPEKLDAALGNHLCPLIRNPFPHGRVT